MRISVRRLLMTTVITIALVNLFMVFSARSHRESELFDNASENAETPKTPKTTTLFGNDSAVQDQNQDRDIKILLPHLFSSADRKQPSPFDPSFKASKHRSNVDLVIGIPSVKRNSTDYLSDTLRSLLFAMNDEEKRRVLIVVLLSDLDRQTMQARFNGISSSFSADISSGLIDVVSPSASFYPDLDRIQPTLGDGHDRMKWRTKQVLDFVYMMMYAKSRGKYFLQLEDDIIAVNQFTTQIINFVANQEASNPDWVFLQFAKLGYIGKLFRSDDLMQISVFYSLFHTAKPVDWLLPEYAGMRVCPHVGNGPASTECQKTLEKAIVTYSPSLFQHTGYYSSLDGKVQPLKEEGFRDDTSHAFIIQPATSAFPNPNATLNTSLRHHEIYTLDALYRASGMFWAVAPAYGDYIQIDLTPPVVLSRFLVTSGLSGLPADMLDAATFEVKPQVVPASLKPNSTIAGFFILASFERGRVDGLISADFGKIQTVRVNIWKNATHWAAINTFQLQA